MAYLGRKGAVAPLTSADIPVGIVEGTDIAFLENASGTQNLGGTYSTERMYLNDSYTLTGDVTITGHLALGTIADSDVVITDDGSTRTITGSGTLETGDLLDRGRETLTGMTGEIGSAVTGSPNLNLGNATFPTGHVIQIVQGLSNTDTFTTGSTIDLVPSKLITTIRANSKILVTWWGIIKVDGNSDSNHDKGWNLELRRTVGGSNTDKLFGGNQPYKYWYHNMNDFDSGDKVQAQATIHYLDEPLQSAGTEITYVPRISSHQCKVHVCPDASIAGIILQEVI